VLGAATGNGARGVSSGTSLSPLFYTTPGNQVIISFCLLLMQRRSELISDHSSLQLPTSNFHYYNASFPCLFFWFYIPCPGGKGWCSDYSGMTHKLLKETTDLRLTTGSRGHYCLGIPWVSMVMAHKAFWSQHLCIKRTYALHLSYLFSNAGAYLNLILV